MNVVFSVLSIHLCRKKEEEEDAAAAAAGGFGCCWLKDSQSTVSLSRDEKVFPTAVDGSKRAWTRFWLFLLTGDLTILPPSATEQGDTLKR